MSFDPICPDAEAPFDELDRKIERINILRSLVGQDFIDPNAPGASPAVIAEVNAQISEFLVDLLNVELGRAKSPASPAPLDAERTQALEWLLSRIVAVMKNPAAPPVVAPVSTPAPIEPVANPQVDYGEPSVHQPMVQRGAAIARPSSRGSGIMDLLKQSDPNLIAPNDPARASMTPQQRADADQVFNQAVRNYEAKKKAEVEARQK